jgi:amino acid transporter
MTAPEPGDDQTPSSLPPSRSSRSVRLGRSRRTGAETPASTPTGNDLDGSAPADGAQDAAPPAPTPPAPPTPDASQENGAVHPSFHVREVRQGHMPGERYVRVHRPFHDTFREMAGDTLVAREHVFRPRGAFGKLWARLRWFMVGRPLATAQLAHERLSKTKALAVFSSDALSSSAYATEEILRILVLAGASALALTLPVALAITLLLVIVGISYRQTIKAYPQGGGSYIVTKDNLGSGPALVAGSALMTDYVLTVAVSVSAGVFALTSAVPMLHDYKVLLAVGFIALITLVNLRGVRESGAIFAAPTYVFIIMATGMIGYGLFGLSVGIIDPDLAQTAASLEAWQTSEAHEGFQSLSIFLVLRAFASGCAALTGTEAISDGVPAFKPPEWKNARTTLTWMVVILGVLFLGISYLAMQLAIVPDVEGIESVVSKIAHAVYGDGILYYLMQAATMLILVLAANTAFSDFPRLSWFLARDHYLPHQFSFRGERLAFSTGIMTLGIVSAVLVAWFGADTHQLIPLYAVGVFTSFTLSQSGMVKRWWTRREPGWHYSLPVNLLGALTTGLVTVIVATTKFTHGAWMVIVLIPIQVWLLRRINGHYLRVAEQLAMDAAVEKMPTYPEPILVVPVPGLNRAVARTIGYARALSKNVTALHITDDMQAADELRQAWKTWGTDVPLVILESKYRALSGPLMHYLDAVSQRNPTTPITVVLAEYVPRRWWEWPLHNQTALRMKAMLFFRPNTAVIDVPYHLVR